MLTTKTTCARVFLLALIIGHGALVSAQEEDRLKSSFAIDDADPESSVPTPAEAMKKPLQMGYFVMLLSERADAATARGDHRAAARFWRALGKAAPDRSLPSARACNSFEAAGDYDSAVKECRDALGKGGATVDDSLRFVDLLLRKPTPLSDSEIEDVESVAAHLKEQLPKEENAGELQQTALTCQLASRLSSVPRLKSCIETLQRLAPQSPQTLVYQWSLAMTEKDFKRAGELLASAKQQDVGSAALETMQQSLQASLDRVTAEQTSLIKRSITISLVALWLGAALFALYRRRQTAHI